MEKCDFKCPYCGEEHDIHRDELAEYLVSYWGEDNIQEIDCNECEKPFMVTEHVERTFSTEEIEE